MITHEPPGDEKGLSGGALAAPPETAVLNRRDAASWLGVSVRQLARLPVPCIRLGRAVRYPVRLVVNWLEQQAEL